MKNTSHLLSDLSKILLEFVCIDLHINVFICICRAKRSAIQSDSQSNGVILRWNSAWRQSWTCKLYNLVIFLKEELHLLPILISETPSNQLCNACNLCVPLSVQLCSWKLKDSWRRLLSLVFSAYKPVYRPTYRPMCRQWPRLLQTQPFLLTQTFPAVST